MKKTAAAAALMAACLVTGASHASTMTVNYQNASSPFGTDGIYNMVHLESWGYDGYANAGQFELTSDVLGDFIAFCIDLGQGLRNGHEYEDTPDLFDAATIDNMDRLFTSAYDQVVDGVSAAAFQVAVWEIVSDTATGLDLDDGTFYTVADEDGLEYNPAVETLADGFLSGLETAETGGFELSFLYSATSQDVVTAHRISSAQGGTTPVPLPAGGLLLIAGLGGLAALRRKAK